MDDNFFKSLPLDNDEALLAICNLYFDFNKNNKTVFPLDTYFDNLKIFLLLEAFMETRKLPFTVRLHESKKQQLEQICNVFNELLNQATTNINKRSEQEEIEKLRFYYRAQLGAAFSYNFSDGDITRIKYLINELREKINSSEVIEKSHKERLLKKLTELEKELSKKMSNLDKFYGLMGEAIMVFKKYGPPIKTVLDTVNSILKLASMVHGHTYELPGDTEYNMLNDEQNTDY